MNQKSLFGMKWCREKVICEEEKSLVGIRARIQSKIEEWDVSRRTVGNSIPFLKGAKMDLGFPKHVVWAIQSFYLNVTSEDLGGKVTMGYNNTAR